MIFEHSYLNQDILHEAFIDDNADVSIREVSYGGDPLEVITILKCVNNHFHKFDNGFLSWRCFVLSCHKKKFVCMY